MARREIPHILVVGGGYVGMYTALRMGKKLRSDEAVVTVVDPQPYMTYQPFLPESAAGNLEPRHMVVSLRRILRNARIVSATVTSVDHASRVATVQPLEGPPTRIGYDVLVMAPGSVSRTLPIPGLKEYAIGFKTVAEAVWLRNRVLERLDVAASSGDPERRRRALTFVFVGGGYAGIEALAELEDMARYAVRRYFREIAVTDMRWVLVEASRRILPEVSPELGEYTVQRLTERKIEVRLGTRMTSVVGGHVELDDGSRFEADTVVWTAGVKPHPLLADTDLPLDETGRLRATAELRVDGLGDAWTAGDCAAVPDLTRPGELCGPSAQHAVRQSKRLADNIVADLRGLPVRPYEHAYAGSVASLGLYKGVAEIYGVKLKGFPAWFMHRTYHMTRMPTANRKARVVVDWTMALLFRRDVVPLGSFTEPQREFRRAASHGSAPPGPASDGPTPEPLPAAQDPEGGGVEPDATVPATPHCGG